MAISYAMFFFSKLCSLHYSINKAYCFMFPFPEYEQAVLLQGWKTFILSIRLIPNIYIFAKIV